MLVEGILFVFTFPASYLTDVVIMTILLKIGFIIKTTRLLENILNAQA